MKMHPVNSSNVEEIGYDEENFTLRVRYHGGRTYDYSGVPLSTYNALKDAPSIGSFMANYIKPQFGFVEV